MIKTQFSSTIKILISNGGGEFTSKSFESFLSSNGIQHQISCPYTPQQNGLVERKHRHLIETTITLLSQASLPSTYWSFAVQSALTLINLFPTTTLDFMSPCFKLYGHNPDIFSLKVFDCACYPYLRPYSHHKLNHRTAECIFLGYSNVSKGYLCLDLLTNKLYICRHVLFNEHKFPFPFTSPSVRPSHPPTPDIWLSNLLYLYSSNQPSILGPYTSDSSFFPIHVSTPIPSVSSPSLAPIPSFSSQSHSPSPSQYQTIHLPTTLQPTASAPSPSLPLAPP